MLLGVDPGTRKCGYAVLERVDAQPLTLGIVPLDEFGSRLATTPENSRLRPLMILRTLTVIEAGL